MNTYDWIVFDSTGTLTTPDPRPAEVYHSVAVRLGSSLDERQVETQLRSAMSRNFFGDTSEHPTSESHEYERWRTIVSETLSDLEPHRGEEAFEQLWGHFARPQAWRVYGDVFETLRRIRESGYRTAVASNFDARLIPILAGLGLSDLFDQVLVNSDLGFSKPSVRFYHEAARRLGQADASRLLMIGDTHRGDVEAARRAGWDSRHLVRDVDDALLALTADL